jgi:hypothetical protein
MTLHYEACGRGVGKSSDERPEVTHPTDQAQPPANRSGV